MKADLQNPSWRYALPAALLVVLVWFSYIVLRDFFLVICWAFIIAYVMWPPYQWLTRALQNRLTLSAAMMTGLIAVVIFLAAYWLLALMQNEVKSVYQFLLTNYYNPPKRLPDSIGQIPWLGNYLQQHLDQLNADQTGVKTQLTDWAKQWLGEFGRFLGGIGRNLLTLGFTLITTFFCFRDGELAIKQLRLALGSLPGKYQALYLQAAGDTVRAVVYGIVLAALTQGILAGIGYSVAGVKAPALLGAITALLAMIPIGGAALVWLPVSLSLLFSEQPWQGTGLILWGIFVISTIDNIIRPLVISGAGRIPVLVVLFGVFGGLRAFGIVGLFLGPVILSVLLAVWRTWMMQLNSQAQQQS